jgi:predicted NAD-dependent protein-ADP-ribosyltransferase YbiA (DUF1768 family)
MAYSKMTEKRRRGELVRFGSGAAGESGVILSNFYGPIELVVSETAAAVLREHCPHVRAGDRFTSSEHAWQAIKAQDEQSYRAFTAEGALARATLPVFERIYHPHLEVAARKLRWWTRRPTVGIVSKLATKRERTERLQLRLRFTGAEELTTFTAAQERAIWLAILRCKLDGCDEFRKALRDTGDAHLLEMARSARDHWGGYLCKQTGHILGGNAMGRYLMELRDTFLL